MEFSSNDKVTSFTSGKLGWKLKENVLTVALSQMIEWFWESSNYNDGGVIWLWLGAIKALENYNEG